MRARSAWIDYAAPMAAFLILTAAEGALPKSGGVVDPSWYAVFYPAKVLIVAAVAWAGRSAWKDFLPRPGAGALATAVVIGLAVAALWVGLDGRYPVLAIQGRREAFDPARLSSGTRAAFLLFRFFGLVVLVPVIEELFWRSFILRWLVRPDFRAVPMREITLKAVVVSAGLFALAHPEWLPALITGLLWAGLLRRTRSLTACLVSHMTANLALGIYVLVTGHWKFW